MKILFYSTKDFEQPYLVAQNKQANTIYFTTEALSIKTVEMAKGYDAISIFANDDASAPVIKALAKGGTKYIAIRAAGFDNVDITAANEADIIVANVPDYSPNAIAEHAVLLMLALNRKILLTHEQVKRKDFTLDKLIGFDLNEKTVGIIGTGKIGGVVAKILHGFGCTILAYDSVEDQSLMNKYDVHYVDLATIYSLSDIITIHLPLKKETAYMINESSIRQMKRGVMLINTARGGIVKTEDILNALETGKVGYFGTDVYEKEKGIFFYDHSNGTLQDTLLDRLIDHPNVIVTPHQAFATSEALTNIATTTFNSIDSWAEGGVSEHELTFRKHSERLVS
jgi:D-lactate dehydrogenase